MLEFLKRPLIVSAMSKHVSGLNDAEVKERIAAGKANVNAEVGTSSIPQIVWRNCFTLFNLVNIAMAVLIVTTGQYKNLSFLGVVFANLVIGLWQEIHAKKQVDALSILTAKEIRVLRGDSLTKLLVEELVEDDVVLLSHGEQVPADAVVLEGEALANESLLTGEQDAIEKKCGSELFSGSFIESGSVYARLTKVGKESYAAKLNAEAKYLKRVASEIMDTLKTIILWSTRLMIPLGVLLFLRIYLSSRFGYAEAILQTAAALIGMIPQGLVLLTSSVFAIATTRLAREAVLVQQAYCVESLARVDVLCLDKTGTITSGKMLVSRAVDASGKAESTEVLQRAFDVVSARAADANETGLAIISAAEAAGLRASKALKSLAFSSKYKYSAAQLEDGCYVLGAAQFVLKERFAELEATVRSFNPLERVLVVGRCEAFLEDATLVGEIEVLGFIALTDEIRSSAADTIAYFKAQGVSLKVISGDDPYTVSNIAASVGIDGAEHYIDASSLTDAAAVEKAAETKAVFGRVSPQLKRELVRALQAQGHTIAMTGDGVNDILALKEADCSIAMASGSAAARSVSEIVLADNDFSHLPKVVAEGRRSINNLERSASLFLVKTAYSALLAAIALAFPPYPFIPVQMSLISACVIGVPSFLLALEPNFDRVRGHFLTKVLTRSLPASLAIVIAIVLTQLSSAALDFSPEATSSICMFLMAAIGLCLIYKISRPLTRTRTAVLALSLGLFIVGVTLGAGFFAVVKLTMLQALIASAVGLITLALFSYSFDKLQSTNIRFDSHFQALTKEKHAKH